MKAYTVRMCMKVTIGIVIDCFFTVSHQGVETPNTSPLIRSYSNVYVLLRRVAWSCQREKHIGQASMRWSTFCSRVSRAFNRRPFVILYSVRNIAVSISESNLVRSSDAQAFGAWVTNGRHTRYLFCFDHMFRNFMEFTSSATIGLCARRSFTVKFNFRSENLISRYKYLLLNMCVGFFWSFFFSPPKIALVTFREWSLNLHFMRTLFEQRYM